MKFLSKVLPKKEQPQTEQPRGTTIISEIDRQRNLREGVRKFINKDIKKKQLDEIYTAESRRPSNERETPLTEAERHDGLLGKLANAGSGEFLPSSGKLEYSVTPVHNEAGKPSTKDRAGNVLRNVGATIRKTVFGK